ncbi:MAG: ATP-binding protein [Methylobacter sp.]|nr:ATP-binding protein [Methylobacter sp.]
MICQIVFPSAWIDASALESTLRSSCAPHGPGVYEVLFRFPTGCRIMVDSAVRLLSLINQLSLSMRRVRLEFEEGEAGTMGYLDRMGFFDHLAKDVDVLPARPSLSAAEIYGGTNTRLVEIASINPKDRDVDLPSRLTDAMMDSCGNRPDAKGLEGAAWTIFAELIDNIFSHSSTQIDGYAALQVYPRGDRVKVAVSDSGLGIMSTLRPAIKTEFPSLENLSDIDLLVEIFRQGISRHGTDRGCGLKGSAAKAIKYNGELDVRLPNIRVLLTPGKEGYKPNTAYCYDGLPLIWGTHICFTFRLDTNR